jgi:ELWxxDGT repeat protein
MLWNGDLYFFALDAGGHGSLFKTDGTALGTVKLADTVMIGGAPDQAASYLDHNGKLLFRAQKGFPNDVKGIYATDGTSTGTYLVQHIPELYFEVTMLPLGGHIYVGDFGSKDTAFWKFDLTPNSGTIIKAPLSNNASYMRFDAEIVYKNAIYGSAHLDGDLGWEAYKFQDIPNNITDVDYSKQTARIYPLPVHDHATLELYVQGNIGNAEIAMYDMTGRTVSSPVRTQLSAGINKLDINTALLANGMYHVVVRGDEYNEVIKIVK